ncbi:MAG: SDR family NAD(P)-dependent oxidoreductase [Halioglobus sp.]|nr:SDR family NAD(P)-dependent oxidoreductase [Halioglobus sp.]
MSKSPLHHNDLCAVIVGNGAIGSALCEALLAFENTRSVALLGRHVESWDDERVIPLFVDALEPDSIAAAALALEERVEGVQVLINTVGVLHWDKYVPEKRLRDIDTAPALQAFQINALFPALLADAFGSLLRKGQPGIFASLSARVGSISDNQLGGWYSYRASKAAQNMLLRTIAREWSISHRETIVVALHPGTVESRLSAPFVSANYPNKVLRPAECAAALLNVIGALDASDSGTFLDWQGKSIPW